MKSNLKSSGLKSFPFGKGFRIGLLLIIFSCSFCKAQWVTIPDANFRNWLNANGYASCMNGTLMDTTCSAVVNEDYVDCSWQDISNLYGIQFFDNLLELFCEYNQLIIIPALPSKLVQLHCYYNLLPSLPSLPDSLKYLHCHNNQLTSLPSLPNKLYSFKCYYNQLTLLPPLPNSLGILNCHDNYLINLPSLPNFLTALYCTNNQITSLPLFPQSLTSLFCSSNQLSSIPTLPSSLFGFGINDNPLLECMPALQNFTGPDYYFNISNTGITCLPNVINHTGYIAAIDTMPICTCTFPSGITTSNITSTSAKVNWSTECCTEYRIQYRVTGTTTWTTKIAVPPLTTKSLIALTPGTTYDLRMRVTCTNGTTYSSWSPIQTFTTLVTCVAPTGITVSNLTQTHATINWNAVANAYAYKFSGRKLGTTAWTTYTIYVPLTVKQLNGLTANTTYQYRMQTVCSSSGIPTSPWTAISTFSTPLRMEDESFDSVKTDFSVFPNPASQSITVTSDFSIGDEIEIKDLLGKTIYNQTQGSDYSNPAETQSSKTIDVSNLSSALYFISIRKNDGSVLIKQFVKD